MMLSRYDWCFDCLKVSIQSGPNHDAFCSMAGVLIVSRFQFMVDVAMDAELWLSPGGYVRFAYVVDHSTMYEYRLMLLL
jgi:hypothetical protein